MAFIWIREEAMACLQETSEAQDFYTTVGIHGNNENCCFQGCEQSKRRFLPHVHWPTFFIYDIGKSSFSSLSTCWQAQHFSPRTCRFLKELRSWTYWSTDGTPADGLKLLSLSTQNFAGSFNSHQIGFKLHMYRRHWITTICLILTYWKLSNCIWSSYG